MNRQYLKSLARARVNENRWPAVGAMFVALLLTGELATNNIKLEWKTGDTSYLNLNLFGIGRSLDGGLAVITGILLIVIALAGILAIAYTFFVGNIITIGRDGWALRYIRGENLSVGAVFDGFKIYKPVLAAGALRTVYTALWSLLFVIPGIVKAYAYSMTGYIIYENPNLSAEQAIDISNRMTQGYKGELFVLDLSFIGWNLLNGLTFGLLGIFHVNPYYAATHAHYYEDLKARALANGRVSPAELA